MKELKKLIFKNRHDIGLGLFVAFISSLMVGSAGASVGGSRGALTFLYYWMMFLGAVAIVVMAGAVLARSLESKIAFCFFVAGVIVASYMTHLIFIFIALPFGLWLSDLNGRSPLRDWFGRGSVRKTRRFKSHPVNHDEIYKTHMDFWDEKYRRGSAKELADREVNIANPWHNRL